MVLNHIFMLLLLFYVLSHSLILNDTPEMRMKCFEQRTYEWDMRAVVKCDNLESYHCLKDFSDSKKFHELCRKFIYISPGNYPVYSPISKTIHQRSCPNNTYQDRLIKSSDLNSCVMKTECTGMGSLVCNNGSTSEDRRCKCDITKEMVIIAYGEKDLNTDICCPDIDPGCMCWKKNCKTGEELNEVYQCVPRCEPGFYRPIWDSKCVSYGSTKSETTEKYPVTTVSNFFTDNTDSLDPGTTPRLSTLDRMSTMMPIITTEVIFCILVTILAFQGVYFYIRYKNRSKNQTVSATTKEGEETTYIGDIIIEGAPSQSISINYQGDHKGDSYTVENSKNIAIGKKATLEVKSNPPTSLLKRDLNASETELECFKAHFDSLETDAKCVDEETTLLKSELNTQETELKCSSNNFDSPETEVK